MDIKKAIKHMLFSFFKLFPLKENTIVFESEGDFCDNSYALYEYMLKNGYMQKYKAVWFVENPSKFSGYENTLFLNKSFGLNFKPYYYLATSKYYIYDHANYLESYPERKTQQLVYLSHGLGIKKGKGRSESDLCNSNIDAVTVLNREYAKVVTDFAGCLPDKAVVTGYARNDYFFENNDIVKAAVNKKYHFDKYKKVLFWMPTFRKSFSENISDDTTGNETGLPIFANSSQLHDFNEYLKSLDVLVVLKLHHLQAEMDIFKQDFSNISVVRDNDLFENNIQLYQFVNLSDGLITDYSSIANDYLLTNKPMIFTLDDYKEYKAARGFVFDDVLQFMPGEHVYNVSEFKQAIYNVAEDFDNYKQVRSALRKVIHTYTDGESSLRILDCLGIIK